LRKFLLVTTLLFSLFLSYGQSQLQHYERKASFDHIYLPFEKFSSSDYKIVYDDSVYDAAKITIKKGKINGVKKINLKFTVSDKVYSMIELTTKSSKKFELLKIMLAKSLSCSPDKFGNTPYIDETRKIKVEIKMMGRRKTIILSKVK
jgi:hypothetical protein